VTTKPEFEIGAHLVPGLAAVALFLVMAAVFVTAPFGDPTGFPADANIVASIGNAMFDLDAGPVASESFLVAFLVIALVLDAALEGSVHLARREEGDEPVALLADGGVVSRALGGADDEDDAAAETGGDR